MSKRKPNVTFVGLTLEDLKERTGEGLRGAGALRLRAAAYDVVLNGVEIGGGLVCADEAEEAGGGGAIDFVTHGGIDSGFDVGGPGPVEEVGGGLDEVGVVGLAEPTEHFLAGGEALEMGLGLEVELGV